MANLSLFNKIILIFVISSFLIDCKTTKKEKKSEKKKVKKPKKVVKEENIDVAASALEWAKNNSIYINEKLILNKKTSGDKHYFFSADSRIQNNTLLLRVPYNMMITQFNLNEMYKDSKNKKFENLWDKIESINNDFIQFFSTKQLFYMSVILENAMRKKKGPLYKKYKELLRMFDNLDMDIYPVFYDQYEKDYLSGSNFGSQLIRAMDSLNEEYIILDRDLNINIPNQDDFIKTRVIALISSINLNNTNYNYSNEFNETIIVPFLDCFTKTIFEDRSNARVERKSIKNTTSNLNDYYLEIYSNDEIYIGGEIILKWTPFSNSELLLYYGFVEEENPIRSRHFMDIINTKFKKDLNITDNKIFKNIKKTLYELNTEFTAPDVINSYKNLSKHFDKYKNRKEGPYEMMLDNLKYYVNLYEEVLSDGNINKYINGKEKVKSIKEIIHQEKKFLDKKVDSLEKHIKKIKIGKTEDKNNDNNDEDL